MYKKLLIAMSVLALAACQKNKLVQSNPGNAISFQAVTNYAKTGTRAAAATAAANEVSFSQNLNSLTVDAFSTTDGKEFFTASPGGMVITKPVSAQEGSTNWTNANTYYWNNGENLDFYAYNQDALNGGKATLSQTAKNITAVKPSMFAEEQKDLVVAYDQDQVQIESVPLVFQHALSQITVNAKCANPDYQIKVLGVKIVGLNTQGDFTFPAPQSPVKPVSSSDLLPSSVWSNLSQATDVTNYYSVKTPLSAPIVLNSTNSSEYTRIMGTTSNFFILPQTGAAATISNKTLSATGAYLAVLVQVDKKSGTTGSTYAQEVPDAKANNGQYTYACVPLVTDASNTTTYTFVPGKKYIYNLTFLSSTNKNAGYHEPKVPPTPNPNPGDKDPNKDKTVPPTEKDKGKQLLGDPILFNVTVKPFVDATEINIDL